MANKITHVNWHAYLIECFEITSSSNKKYIQTQQKGGKK